MNGRVVLSSGFSATALPWASAQIRRLLNVRYILWPDYQLGEAPAASVVSRLQYQSGAPHSTLLAENGLPRARLVASSVVLGDAEAVPYMLTPTFDPSAEVVLAEEPPVELSPPV